MNLCLLTESLQGDTAIDYGSVKEGRGGGANVPTELFYALWYVSYE